MKRIYTFLIVILPIIAVYKSPISGIDLGTFAFISMSFFILLFSKGRVQLIKPMLIFLIYIVFSTLISMQLQGELENILIILRTGKFVLLILLILHIGNKELFDIEFGLKVLKTVSIVSVLYLILQTIGYKFFNVLLPNGILSLIIDEAYLNVDYVTEAKFLYRPSSFFIEPSSFSQYNLLYLSYSIFGLDNKKLLYNWRHALYISVGILLTGSGQGILLVFATWGLWVLNKLFLSKMKFKQYLLLAGIIVSGMLFIPYLLQNDFISKALSRVFTASTSSGGNAFLARIKGYDHFNRLPSIFKIIGMGYGNVPPRIYFNSAAYTLYCSGMIGGIILLYIFWDIFKKGIGFQKEFTIIYFILTMGTTAFKATSICFYLSFIYTADINRMLNNRDSDKQLLMKSKIKDYT